MHTSTFPLCISLCRAAKSVVASAIGAALLELQADVAAGISRGKSLGGNWSKSKSKNAKKTRPPALVPTTPTSTSTSTSTSTFTTSKVDGSVGGGVTSPKKRRTVEMTKKDKDIDKVKDDSRDSSTKSEKKIYGVKISGIKNCALDGCNGEYEPTQELCGGQIVYRRRETYSEMEAGKSFNVWLEYCVITERDRQNRWQLKTRVDKGTDRCSAMVVCYPPNQHPEACEGMPWEVWRGSNFIAISDVVVEKVTKFIQL